MPFPSKACKTCKTRRVKCDETQPKCLRCVKANRVCYDMPDGNSNHVFHLENPYSSGQKKRPRGPRPRPTPTVEASSTPVLQPLPVDLKTQAISYYLQYHLRIVEDAPGLVRPAWDDLLPIWSSRDQCPILDLAVSSIALAIFSRAHNHSPAAIQASENYSQLLHLAQETIFSLDETNIDICLLASFFMGRYEQVVYCPIPTHLRLKFPLHSCVQSFSHHDGGLAILKSWKEDMSSRFPATNIIKRTRRGMIRSAILRNIALPDWILKGADFGEKGLELEYDCLVVRLVGIRERLAKIVKEEVAQQTISIESRATAWELSKQVRVLDLALQDWITHFPSEWAYQRHTLSEGLEYPSKDFYTPKILTYSRIGYAAVWNLYFGTRILINCTQIRILDIVNPDASEQRSKCLVIINEMADDFASSIPFCRQKIKAIQNPDQISGERTVAVNMNNDDEKPYMATTTTWPLSMASGMSRVEMGPKIWFRSEISRIGRMMFDRVLEEAETEKWLDL